MFDAFSFVERNYGTCASFALVNYGPRTAVAGVVGEYSRGRNSFPGLRS